MLAANLILDKVPEMRNEPNFYDSIVLNKNGVDIGIIGYLTPDTKYLAPKNKVEYEDEVVAIRREAKRLKEKGVNILIALGHSGFVKDLAIAKNVEDIDLVIGGHSNTFLLNHSTDEKPECPEGPYPVLVTQPSGRNVPVVQAYAYTKYIGRLLLTFDSKGEIINQNGTSILLDQNVPRDPDVLDMVMKYQSKISSKYNQIVGTSKAKLNGVTCRLRECNIGSFITDAMLDDKYENGVDASIAVIQGGRIRSSIEKSEKSPFEMTLGDWMTVLPFSDTLSVVTMNGSVLMQALEHSVSTWRPIDSTGQFLQFSEVTIVYDLAKKPGSRVIDVNATCSNCGQSGQVKVEENYEYKVMMPSFLANGGDGYQMFENLPSETLKNNELISVLNYLKKIEVINPQIYGRIKILNEDKVVDVPSMKTSSDVCNDTPSGAVKTSASANLCMSVLCLLTYPIVSL